MTNKKRNEVGCMQHYGGNIFAAKMFHKSSFVSIQNPSAEVKEALAKKLQNEIPPAITTPAPTINGLVPDASDYIYPVFRALSKTVVTGQWLDFTIGDVLKNSTELLNGVTVFPDHMPFVELWLGAVIATEWEEEKNKIPAGINDTMKIDWKMNEKIARGLLMQPPAIHSSSVTVIFEMEKSHQNMKDYEFWLNLGREIDGELVRIKVMNILEYLEHSLVFKGADIYANGRGMREFSQSMSEKLKSISVAGSLDGQQDDSSISPHSEQPVTEQSLKNEENKTDGDEMLQKESYSLLGISEDSTTEAIHEAIAKLVAERDTAKPAAEIGQKYLHALRQNVVRLMTLVEGKLESEMLNTIEKAELDTVKSLHKMYSEKAEKNFNLLCQECGSGNVGRRTSKEQLQSEKATDTSQLANFLFQR